MSFGGGVPRVARWAAWGALSAVALLPLLPVVARFWSPAAALEQLLRPWFELHCERDPARISSLAGVPLAVCTRCSGIYFGFGLGAFVGRPALTPPRLRLWVGAAALLMLLDVVLERRGVHGAWSTLRLLTGLLLAYPVGVGLGRAVLLRAQPRPRQAAQKP
jgi:uncharacterized membrane protein